MMKFAFCPVSALLLLALLPDPGVKGQIIPVPDTQPPIFLGHYSYPITDVTLKYTYLSPTQCPVSEGSKLSSITVSIPRGGSILNAIEIAANHDFNRAFEAHYVSEHGYILTEIYNVPPSGANPLCQWSWTSDPLIFAANSTDLSINDVFIPTFFTSAIIEINFIYQFVPATGPIKSAAGPAPSDVVVTPQNMTVDYHLVAEGGTCSFPAELLNSIPAQPLTVSIQVGGSALNVLERAAEGHLSMSFTVSNSLGVLYFPVSIAGVSITSTCTWCLTYKPPSSSEIVIPDVNLQNFVIPTPDSTLRMYYTSSCSSAYQVALARKNWTYFEEHGLIKGPPENDWCSLRSLILALIVVIPTLFLCVRYFR